MPLENNLKRAIAKAGPAILTGLVLLVYLLYVGFVIHADQGPVDYETFMRIGTKFLRGEEVYGENSYYPLPYVMVFGAFAALPRPLSMALWLLLPVAAALLITGWRSWALLYAPLFGHFLGGQTAMFGMLGLWGYRRNQDVQAVAGGIWLALTLLKPQLAVVPLAWAAWHWWKELHDHRRVPRQALGWLVAAALIYLPSFALQPDWIERWLSNPRPLFERALAGLVPRGLVLLGAQGWLFGLLLLVAVVAGLILLWRRSQGKLTLDLLILFYFVVSPLVHDYDLIQTIPLLETKRIQWLGVLLGIPTLLVILFAYEVDAAWMAVTIIAPGLLIYQLTQKKG